MKRQLPNLFFVLLLLPTFIVSCGKTIQSVVKPEDERRTIHNAANMDPEVVVNGGFVLFFRHTSRDPIDPTDLDLNNGECGPGSDLNAKGVNEATAIGAKFKALNIGVDKVYPSLTCRNIHMANLAFGFFTEAKKELAGVYWDGVHAELIAALQALISTPPARGKNTVLLGHMGMIKEIYIGVELELAVGDAAVFLPLGKGGYELVGHIKKEKWISP